MKLPEGAELVYIIGYDAWYAEANREANPRPYLSIEARYPGDGCAWEFEITEHELQGSAVRVEMFHDAFDAFAEVEELFDALTDLRPHTLAEVIAILDELGARDATPRVYPYKVGA